MRVAKSSTDLAVDRRGLARQATDILREQILGGHFAPGFRLIEASLADQLRLSRGTIRSALQQLAHEGLVDCVPYTGWAVRTLSPEDARELWTLRGVLEGLAARLAAEAMTPERKLRLQSAYRALTEAARSGDRARVVEADLNLHKTILELSGHRRLNEQYKLVEQQIRMFIALSDSCSADLDEVAVWHDTLVEAIGAGNGEQAERLARDNAEKTGQILIERLRNQRPEEPHSSRAGVPAVTPADEMTKNKGGSTNEAHSELE